MVEVKPRMVLVLVWRALSNSRTSPRKQSPLPGTSFRALSPRMLLMLPIPSRAGCRKNLSIVRFVLVVRFSI